MKPDQTPASTEPVHLLLDLCCDRQEVNLRDYEVVKRDLFRPKKKQRGGLIKNAR